MIDPVCGMTTREDGPNLTTYRGTLHSFCGKGCLAKFLAAGGDAGAAAGEADRIWSVTLANGFR